MMRMPLYNGSPLSFGMIFGSFSIALGLSLLISAIVLNFLRYRSLEQRQKFVKSPVDTLTMAIFAFLLCLLIVRRIGQMDLGPFKDPAAITGGILFLLGVAINLWGRKILGDNWSNQIRIRSSHTLITEGPYRYVRHPLYASIMLMQFAAALIYGNWAAVALNVLFYIPMMHYRAAQEEEALKTTFTDYAVYIKTTGRFWPKFGGHHENR